MRIINIIDRFDKVNFGIWNAAIATAKPLKEKFKVESELWFPETDFDSETNAKNIALDLKVDNVSSLIKKRNLNPTNDIIVTHGCWQYPTRWGAELKKKGFKWIYVPHGMLEPWSMKQKWLQKKIYFSLFEGRLTKNADIIRAVGTPEFKNLKKTYPNTVLIPNGTEIKEIENKDISALNFLFMARLHHKKGIIPLVKAWKESKLYNSNKFKLIVAGPDDGELARLKSEIINCTNIEYIGAVYGKEKEKLLKKSHFYVLPSYSEGFPTSVVEAMSFGLIPIISKGCNFPEASDINLAIQVTPEIYSILNSLESAINLNRENLNELSKSCSFFIRQNYSLKKIAETQYQLYHSLLNHEENR